jgi:D-alanine-D-alanine ligase-like ATP-grasp enzyme
MNINFKTIWDQVKDIVLKSLLAYQVEIPNSPSSFELLGYDIIIDTDLKSWLLEINTSPYP